MWDEDGGQKCHTWLLTALCGWITLSKWHQCRRTVHGVVSGEQRFGGSLLKEYLLWSYACIR